MKPKSISQLVAAIRDAMRNQLWPVPALGIAIGLAAGFGVPRLDELFDQHLPPAISDHLFGGGADAARTLLGAVASSLITVTALTFSLTVVTLQLASGQFSPRLLRSFTRDRAVHLTLALFLGTFTFAFAVLRTVRSTDEESAAFVPQMAVTLAFLLCIASVLALVLFLAHLASEIRVETMFRRVHRDATATLHSATQAMDQRQPLSAPHAPAGASLLLTPHSGFLLSTDSSMLVELAQQTGSVIAIDAAPGDVLVEGVPIGRAWAASGSLNSEALEQITSSLSAGLRIGFERTEEQDIAYGLRQLADVVAKALSPGVNDPTTAIHGLGHVAALLGDLTQHSLGPVVIGGDDDHITPRLVLARPSFTDLLDMGVTQARHYGASDPFVAAALLRLLRDVAWRGNTTEHADAVRAQLARLRASIADQQFDATEHAGLVAEGAAVEAAIDGRWADRAETT